jgi:hypothetical protein
MKNFVIYPDQTGRWKARPGYRVLVMDCGAVRFDFPQDWLASLDSKYIRIVDREPPSDRCSLLVSCRWISPGVAGFPIRELLHEVTIDDNPERPIVEAAWRQMRFIDNLQRQDARTRVCLARGGRTLATIVFDF